MASVSVVFSVLFLLSVAVGALQKPSNLVTLGSSLSPVTNPISWVSPSGHFAFGFYPKGSGFAVGIWLVSKPDNYVVWTANRDDPPVSSNAKIEFTRDGKLLLRTKQGQEKLIADKFPAVSASMLDSGNFVLSGNDSNPIWKSFGFPTDTILGGQDMPFGSQLISSKSRQDRSSGEYSLSFQDNGKKLVSCPVNSMATPNDSINGLSMAGDCYWSILTRGSEYFYGLKLSQRGRLYFNSSEASMHIVFNSSYADKNKTIIYRATLDADGVLRLYSHSFGITGGFSMSIEWSAVQNLCEVTGICGFNSFCSGNNGIKANCSCLPGFVFTDPGNNSLGCYRNLSHEEVCRRKELAISYNITSLDYVSWGGTAYSVLKTNKEDCSKSCLEDCRCKAALYSSGKGCSRYKLPLMYVRKDQTEYVAFVKLSLPTVERFLIERNKRLLTFVAWLGPISFLCSVVAISSFFAYRSRVHRYKKLPKNSDLGVVGEFTLRSFSVDELEKATDGFKEELGRGHFGAVYKGAISEGNKVVAVKRLEVVEEGEREFQAEMTGIGRTHHRNVVQLFGFCVEGSTKLLVYEYMRNGSLADLLFKAENPPIWKERVRIAVEVARGILYLHEECEYQIIHCDIKPQNILMDDSWTAKISDFRLAKVLIPNQNGLITGVRGTGGYVAPEWQKNVLISVKADVFSFGVVLLEIVCCRSNMEVSVSTADEVLLSDWAYRCLVAGRLDKLVGDEEVEMSALERMVKVGLLCIQEDPSLRPSMKDVIPMLEVRTVHVPVPPPPTPSLLVS
ncbi:hypothetical protein PVL29_005328 [Vitis rotundifolia]|uniref:Receptor-like serine/threonine-protein kinase n=1 Tax=Vitis rotundifolia TaxID=103349 RepID=A0AA39AAM3_VITRO|nr:hypothetical protein PVL29_005328 [Vitis rotundifolia]